jgi:branched-chain amino acid transport system permease protein
MRNSRTLALVIFLPLLAIVGVGLPFLISNYYVDVLTMLLINVIMVVAFRLITTTGGWSLAQLPLMGAGAYASGLLTGSLGWPFWLSLPVSALFALGAGLVMSYPLARTKGFAFFIASYAAGEAMRLCWTRFRVPFGGHAGLTNVPPPGHIGSINFSKPVPYYFLALIVTAVCLWLMYRLSRSRIGATFHAIHSQDGLAKSIGINVTRYKILVFAIAAFFSGVAGVLLIHRMWAIEPEQFAFTPTLYILVWAVFGGTRTFVGPIAGVCVLTLVSELLIPLAEWTPMIYGAILILTLLFFPEGLEGVPARALSLWRRWRNGGNAPGDLTPEDLMTEGQG